MLDTQQSFALFALCSIVLFAALAWANSARLARIIAERQGAESRLRDSQQLLQAIIDNTPAIIYVKAVDGRYLLANRRFEEIFQLEHGSVLGRTDYALFTQEQADGFRSMDARVAAADAPLTEEEAAPHADGVTHAYVSVKAPLRDSAGQVYAVFGISTDITERKRAEDRLRTQAERLSLLDRSTRAIAERQDLHSIFQVAIRSLEEHLPIDFGCICVHEPARGALEVACVGVKSRELAQELALTEQARIDIDRNGLGRCVSGQLVYEPDVAGSEFPFPARLARAGLRAVVFAPLTVERRVFGLLVAARRRPESFASTDCEFLRQLSEHLALAAHQAQLYGALQRAYEDLRQTQQAVMQQERLRALGQMASGIAHDINNALSPAALYAELLLDDAQSLSSEAREYLTIIQQAINGVGQTVGRMRMFYRQREPELAHVLLDLNPLLSQVLELTRARWSSIPQESGIVIELDCELAPHLPRVLGTESEIRDALTNLILNAADAMPNGGTLSVRTREDATRQKVKPGVVVVVEIRDTGVGMTEEVRLRCLEPFFTTKGERGTGLGLAMVYGMAERHSAGLEIDSEVGVGTTVRLIFAAATLTDGEQSPALVRDVQPQRILLVDDDPMLLDSLRHVLETDGHRVTITDGGQKGIDEFRAARDRGELLDVVITDLGMPKIDGRSVAAAIKSTAADTPVILLTGWGQRPRSHEATVQQVDRVLSKPPRVAELRLALADLTKQRDI